ncbi:ATP-binding protein [Streptomyces sp. NPDC047706]|uniref:ATP-binding protein n=1 Tax=Streptomyces sp. NPDC047706 TaxID=3365486 RepID=UPI003722AAE0
MRPAASRSLRNSTPRRTWRAVGSRLRTIDCGLIRYVDVAELLAAELVSNAVRHTKGPAAMRVKWAEGVLRIGAWDADPEPPEPPRSRGELEEVEAGRGMALVRACADVWGWQPSAREGNRGKFVWCELGAA